MSHVTELKKVPAAVSVHQRRSVQSRAGPHAITNNRMSHRAAETRLPHVPRRALRERDEAPMARKWIKDANGTMKNHKSRTTAPRAVAAFQKRSARETGCGTGLTSGALPSPFGGAAVFAACCFSISLR